MFNKIRNIKISFDAVNEHSMHNRSDVLKSTVCGCYYCLKTFPPAELSNVKWQDGGETATCPHCKVDAVIGDASGYKINVKFLTQINECAF